MQLKDDERGILKTVEGETMILLPPCPICTTVGGSSGNEYSSVLVDDPNLQRPVSRINIPEEGIVYGHPYG